MKRKVLILSVLLVGLIPIFGVEAGYTQTLPVPVVEQQMQYWCWAATTEAILSYYGNYIPQCSIVDEAFQCRNRSSNCCSYLRYCDKPWQLTGDNCAVNAILWSRGIATNLSPAALTEYQVSSEIAAGRPFYIAIKYYGIETGHVVIGRGYYSGKLYIMDPADGYVTALYSWVLSNNDFYWDQTLLTSGNGSPSPTNYSYWGAFANNIYCTNGSNFIFSGTCDNGATWSHSYSYYGHPPSTFNGYLTTSSGSKVFIISRVLKKPGFESYIVILLDQPSDLI